jgi:carbamoyl-phosphate synthase large subunit
MVFGGGQLQLSIINLCKKMGFSTVVIDPDKNAIAKSIADYFFIVSGTDFHTTIQIAKNFNIKGVVSSATDHPILMMSKIAEELELPFPTFNSCDVLLDKGKFKGLLKSQGLSYAKGIVFKNDKSIQIDGLTYPVILKPVSNSGSRGVIKCESYEDVMNNIQETIQFSHDGSFIIEEFIEGDEISVEALVINSCVEIIQITDKMVTSPPYNVELGHIQPSYYWFIRDQIRDTLQKVVNESKLNNCAIHPEIKINNNQITN